MGLFCISLEIKPAHDKATPANDILCSSVSLNFELNMPIVLMTPNTTKARI